MNLRPCHLFLASLALSLSSVSLRAQFKFGNGSGDGRWSNPANWTGRGGGYPSGPGIGAEMGTADAFVTVLDIDATVGGLRNNAGSARIWTQANAGGFTLTLDGTGFINGFGSANTGEIRATSSGGIVCAANLRLCNTNLDVGTVGSNHPSAAITLTGSITAATNQTITIRNNRRQTNLQGDIGKSGAGNITLINLSSGTVGDANQLVVAGNLGPKVTELIQGEGVCEGTVLAGANPGFRGRVSVSANSISVLAGATLGDFNTVSVANLARLNVHDVKALGVHAGLEIERLGGVILSYRGTSVIDALSFDGGMTFAAPGGSWGALGSGAEFESAQIEGPGLLRVLPGGTGPR